MKLCAKYGPASGLPPMQYTFRSKKGYSKRLKCHMISNLLSQEGLEPIDVITTFAFQPVKLGVYLSHFNQIYFYTSRFLTIAVFVISKYYQ